MKVNENQYLEIFLEPVRQSKSYRPKFGQRSDYTFKYNKQLGRHGWLRLTPAYSVKLVKEIIENVPKDSFIFDPFSGTATSGLVAAEQGLSAHCLDINPFLIWLGNAKCRNYSKAELDRLKTENNRVLTNFRDIANEDNWIPEIHNITRWWCQHTLKVLAALRKALVNQFGEPRPDCVANLAWIAFCRLIIETSSAAFNKDLGFTNIGSRIVRKRNSKKELFEYCVYATYKESRNYEPQYFSDTKHLDQQLALF